MSARDLPAVLWLALVLGVMPWGAIESSRRQRAGAPRSARGERLRARSRPQLYLASVLSIGQLLFVTVLLDGIDRWPTVRKSLAFPPHGIAWVLGAVCAHQVVSLAAMALRRLRRLPLEAGTVQLLPRTRGELARFAPLALMAGLYEEFLYRGFAPDHLARWGLPPWLAVAVATASFGLSHGYKSLVGMVRSALIGLVLAAPVVVTGTVLPSIVAHTLMDLLAGVNTLPLARRLGVAVPEPEPAPTAAAETRAAGR